VQVLNTNSIRGLTDVDLLPKAIADDRWRFEQQVSADGGPLCREERLPRPDGREAVFLSEKLVCDQQDGAGCLLGFSSDITELRPITEQLKASEQRFRLLAENARDVIWTMAADGDISYVSPSVQWLRGISPEEAMAQSIRRIHPTHSRQRVMAYLRKLGRDCDQGRKPQPFRGELEYFGADGSTIWCDVLALPVLNEDDSLRYLLGTSPDITERKRYEQELNLTNQQLTIQQLLSSSAVSGEPLAMILCDIDHFKAVNDSHGHSVGDQVLVEFSRRLKHCLRGSDRLGRWGGEEFLVLVPQGTACGAGVLAEKLREAIAERHFEPVGQITASFGVAQHRRNEPFTGWFQRVDSLLYRAKAGGRDLVMVEQD
jgi:diguanylate cyclase (GGDEF)-like protein/PAS domain S-box-containing protein